MTLKILFYKVWKLLRSSLFLMFFISITPVHAYFDPVTTSTILQGLVAIIAAIILYIKNPKQIFIDIKNLFVKSKDKDLKNIKDDRSEEKQKR